MNYLFPLDTYFIAPLSEFFTDRFAMPVVNTVHSCMAKVINTNISDYVSPETSIKWSDRTIRCLTYLGLKTPSEPNTSTVACVTKNVILVSSRILLSKYITQGIFVLLDYSIAPILGDAYTSNRELIKTAHSVGSLGVWILCLASNYRSMQH